jgi:MFS family permease
MVISGPIVESWGWQWVFVVFGGLGFLWLGVFWLVVANEPKSHRWISKTEVEFILHSQQKAREVRQTQTNTLQQLSPKGTHSCEWTN